MHGGTSPRRYCYSGQAKCKLARVDTISAAQSYAWSEAIEAVHKKRLYKLPKIIWAGVGTGFFFAVFIVFYPWLFMSHGRVANDFPAPILFFLSLPCGIAIHALRVVTKTRFIPSFKAEMFGVK